MSPLQKWSPDLVRLKHWKGRNWNGNTDPKGRFLSRQLITCSLCGETSNQVFNVKGTRVKNLSFFMKWFIPSCVFSTSQYRPSLPSLSCVSPLSLCLVRPWRMRMKWRLFSVSLSVNMAIPPMPEFSSSDVSVELKVSVHKTHYHIEYLHSLTGLLYK